MFVAVFITDLSLGVRNKNNSSKVKAQKSDLQQLLHFRFEYILKKGTKTLNDCSKAPLSLRV